MHDTFTAMGFLIGCFCDKVSFIHFSKLNSVWEKGTYYGSKLRNDTLLHSNRDYHWLMSLLQKHKFCLHKIKQVLIIALYTRKYCQIMDWFKAVGTVYLAIGRLDQLSILLICIRNMRWTRVSFHWKVVHVHKQPVAQSGHFYCANKSAWEELGSPLASLCSVSPSLFLECDLATSDQTLSSLSFSVCILNFVGKKHHQTKNWQLSILFQGSWLSEVL